MSNSLEFKQELANSVSHGFGLLFGIVSIPVLISLASVNGNVAGLVGASIFGFSFLMVYTASTLYHSFQRPEVKRVLKVLDHISIYFLIAGSYTPFLLMYLMNATGITVLAVVWTLAILGVFYKLFLIGRYRGLSLAIYLGMGWMLIFIARSFFSSLPVNCSIMLGIGGGLYTLGVIFYAWEKLPYHHAIWHVFVLAASICHYVAVLLAVA